MKKTVGIGFVGVGNISGIYLKNITHLFKELEITDVTIIKKIVVDGAEQNFVFDSGCIIMDNITVYKRMEIVL